MEISELRLGNLIEQGIVNGIGYNLGVLGVACIENNFMSFGNFYSYSQINPIKLNEEWLLKFGFDNSLDMIFIKNISDYSQIKLLPLTSGGDYNGMYALCNYSDFQVNIKYVHQLQNLYFALTGEELTIKE